MSKSKEMSWWVVTPDRQSFDSIVAVKFSPPLTSDDVIASMQTLPAIQKITNADVEQWEMERQKVVPYARKSLVAGGQKSRAQRQFESESLLS